MALVLSGVHSSGPGLAYELYADQTGGSGNSRTVKLTLKLKVNGSSSSWYGYPMNHRFNINGTWSGYYTTKGTESWNGGQAFRTYEYTATTDVGTTSSKAITVGFQTDSYNGSNSWDTTKTGNFTVGQTNTPPYFTSGEQWLRLRDGSSTGTVLTGTIPENVSSIYADWGYASDNEGGTITYILQEQVNGGGWTTIDTGTDRVHQWNIGSGNEGQSRRLWVTAKDSSNAQAASGVYSTTITKNTLTGGSFTGHSNDIGFDTTSFTLNFNRGSNSNGSTVYMMCYSDNITVHNQQELTSGTSQTISIWRSGAYPSGPYIKFDDLKNYFKGSNYNGRLHVGLRTRNDYGTYKWAGGSIGVDLRTNPNPATNQQISTTTTESTMYKKVAFANNYYFLPDGSAVARVKWSAGSGKLGEAISYELYVAYGSGGWQKLADLASGTTYYNHQIPKQTVSQQFKYLIRTVTSYGYYSDAVTSAQTLHFYNQPGLTQGTITRGATTAEVKITVKSNSSIPNIGTTGSWKMSATNQTGNLTAAQTEQTITTTGLTDNGTYTLAITFNDNTGFSGNQVANIAIGANSPLFFVNKYGVGVAGAKATSNFALNINGLGKANGFMATGFDTHGTDSSKVNYWAKVATLKITGQFGDASCILKYLDQGSGNSVPTTGEVTVRVKQQSEMGQLPVYSCYVTNSIIMGAENFKVVITTNTVSLTEAQLWFKISQTYTTVSFAPLLVLGDVTVHKKEALQQEPPSGNNKQAVYIDSVVNTLEARSNANGKNIKVGDDAYIGDKNLPYGIAITGASNENAGYLYFGTSGCKVGFSGKAGDSGLDIYSGSGAGAKNEIYLGTAKVKTSGHLDTPSGNGTRSIVANGDNNYSISLNSHNNATWFRNVSGRWAFQKGADGDDWTQAPEIYLENTDKGNNGSWMNIGQRQSNQSEGKYRGVRVVNYTGGSVISGDVDAKYYQISNVHGTNALAYGNGDNATFGMCNIDFHAWWGLGIKGMAGNAYGDGTRTLVFNARHGNLQAKGAVSSNQYKLEIDNIGWEFNSKSVRTTQTGALDRLNQLQIQQVDNIVPYTISEDREDIILEEPITKVVIRGIEEAFPELVSYVNDDEENKDTIARKYVDLYGLLSTTIKALQEADIKTTSLEQENENLKLRLKAIEEKLGL